MANERNALAELAEFLNKEASPSSEEFKAKAIAKFGVESWKMHEERKHRFLRASRIVAELAKVRVSSELRPNITDLLNMFYECRAIMEEEEKDGK